MAKDRSNRATKKAPRPARTPRNVKAKPTRPEPARRTVKTLKRSAPPGFLTVGIGASAGGLEAITELLRELPPDSGVCIVFVQHLAPKHDSILASLLADATPVPVVTATEGARLQPNHVFVIPPNAHMAVSPGGKLHLLPRPEDRTQFNPIDVFFRSLAEYAQNRAVGVVLSGNASDGSAGLREIKAAAGITLVQDPKTARYDSMPRAAIQAGAADLVLAPAAIARELARISHDPAVARPIPDDDGSATADGDGAGAAAAASIATRRRSGANDGSGAPVAAAPIAWGDESPTRDEQIHRVFSLLRNASGIDFTHYKQPTIRRRLQRRMVLHKLNSLEQYLKLLKRSPAEVNALFQDILIHVTRFFREPDSFTPLASRVFPAMLKDRRPDDPIRIWVPGCSTGEEAYSIAIAALEFLDDDGSAGTPVQLFATDVSEAAIEQARTGVYPATIAADVSPERLRRFFTKVDGAYRIAKSVRDLCVFARQDLTRDPPFSRLDLIVCRNVLIYLGPVLQKRVMHVFHYALKPGGVLMLGGSETVGLHGDLFTLVDKRHKLYARKLAAHRLSMDFPAHAHASGGVTATAGASRAEAARREPAPSRAAVNVQSEANRVVLSRFAPPGVIVDDDLQIVQFRGQTGPFLEPAPGEASLNVLKMVREGLLYDLRTALYAARKGVQPVRKTGLRVKYNGHVLDVNLEVIPLIVAGDKRHYLILFEDLARTTGGRHPGEGEPAAAGAAAPPTTPGKSRKLAKGKKGKPQNADEATEAQLARLQQELTASREYLQSIIQDLEAANEELQSANEEILSSNEELQSTNEELDTAKEELQSTNEELNTLNEELHGRNEELSRVNSDLINLLGAVQIAIVMVASDLRIRRFTPTAEKVLNLIPTDVGRPISDIKPNIDCPDLEQIIAEVIDTVAIREREVRDRAGRWYSMRVRPYKSTDNRIDGAIIALFDSEGSQRLAAGDEEGRAFVRAALESVDRPLLVLDADWTVRLASPAFARVTGLTDGELEGADLFDLARRAWKLDDLRDHLDPLATGRADGVTFDVPRAEGDALRLRVTRTPNDPEPVFIITPDSDAPDSP